ncbi:recombinase RecT [Streptomyces sp. NPDC057250]|uniref:recombinase RecT n=1 Tax=Streptomyces sp. NPDC057250 TaxID=3346068 RepID=UPI003637F553
MAPNTLRDRVRAATVEKTTPTAPAAEDIQHERTADGADGERPAGHEPDETEGALSWLRRYEDQITEALPEHVEADAFWAAVRAALPSLRRCSPASKLQAVLTGARFGLAPDGKVAVIRADGAQAVFVPMYRGYIDLMHRSGRIESVHVGLIHEAEEWSFEPSAPYPLDFTHKARPDMPKAERGPVILAYAFARMRGGGRSQVVLLNREDAEEIRDTYSEAYRRAQDSGAHDSYWHTHFTDMWIKSGVRRLEKWVPTSAAVRALGDVEDAGEAGQVQVTLAPDPQDAALAAEAERAHRAAEATQDPARPGSVALPVKPGTKRGRSRPKKQRGGRR